MTTYGLYLESGPRRRKTMVHVLDLLGCVAVGPTTEEALAATPDAIRAYRRFLRRHDEPIDPGAPFETEVVEHVTEGQWAGHGSPYLTFAPDFVPITAEEIETFLGRVDALYQELATWTASQSDDQLDLAPATGERPAREILLHVLGSPGAYLSAALGTAPGFSKLQTAAQRGELALSAALRRVAILAAERVRATTPEERGAVRELSARSYTLRKAHRRMLEHAWEHLAELSRRPGGPEL